VEGDEYGSGIPRWVALRSADPDLAGKFYAQQFEWEIDEPGADGWRTARLHGEVVAELGPSDDPVQEGWTAFVGVTDVDEAVGRAVAAGGGALENPSDKGGAVVLTDPAGVRFGVRRVDTPAAGHAREPGTFSWAELISDDIRASAAFYGALFGWRVTEPEGPLHRREWQIGGQSIAGLLPRPPAMAAEIPPYWDVYFGVREIECAAEAGVAAGGTLLMPPTDIGRTRIAVLLDPAGAVFTLAAGQ
jgi:predicted enzyme related to lactoylglutathione lyase